MKTDELREKYLDFFKSKDHRVCESDVLVPKWDNTVLFTPAGMNPFKDHFLGKVELEFTRATSCQKCLRTGDIENVGRTAYHHTFFEMLGNFSFGDYFKREAIHWAWEFLTDKKWLGIDPDRLTVTVYLDDDEAFGFWHKDIGLSPDRITRMDEYDNFWPAGAPSDGPDGVCGPCSEIFYHPDNGAECEIWNLVFTQFNRAGTPPDNLSPLPSQNIDTGMGLERIAATLQGVETNFHIDSLLPIVEAAAEICGIKYDAKSENGRRLRRITDHVRACTMAIHENVYPGANNEEYVIRRLLRRAVLQGHEMGLRDPFLYQLVPAVVDSMSRPYPDLKTTVENVQKTIKNEESGFLGKLDNGLARIDEIFGDMKSSGSSIVSGDEAFKLFTTYGFPAELFESIASDQGFSFDRRGFDDAMQQHAIDSGRGMGGVMGDTGPIDDIKREYKLTQFLGYEGTEAPSAIAGLIVESRLTSETDDHPKNTVNVVSERVDELVVPLENQTQIVVLEQTSFYGESGGQVGDTGVIEGPTGKFCVTDTQKNGDIFVHFGHMLEGKISADQTVVAKVDSSRRSGICRAHTATHILHYALQENIGQDAQQRGSKVENDILRFDFSCMDSIPTKTLDSIEQLSNARIHDAVDVSADILPLAEARTRGAMMLFGEKYPDPVRMVSIGQFSKELCGGIHVSNSNDIGVFEIISEDSTSANTRRIQALTGDKAKGHQDRVRQSVEQLASILESTTGGIPDAVRELQAEVKELKKQLSSGKKSGGQADEASQSNSNPDDYYEIRAILKKVAATLNVSLFDVESRVKGLINERTELEQQLEELESAEILDADGLIQSGETIEGVLVIVKNLPGANSGLMRQLIDSVRKKTEPVALFLAAPQGAGKCVLVAGISRGLVDRGISAGAWVKQIAPVVGGGGGGKPDLAQAGGKNPEKIDQALEQAVQYMKSQFAS